MSTLLFFALLMSLSCYAIQGVHKISRETNTNFTFQLENDVEYHCVDIYKQPAFNNILLKNHKIQMEPNFLSMESKRETTLSRFELDACPPGTVPIHKTKVNSKKLLRSLSKFHLRNIHPVTEKEPGIHYAAYGKTMDSKFNGAGAMIDLRNPLAQNDQVSAAQVWVGAGPEEQFNSIQLGWQVHPHLYGDSQTRLTAFWTVTRDNNEKTGCYNLLCPGFIQVNPKYFLGRAFANVSLDGGPYFSTQPQIKLERGTGNWWLIIEEDIILGYYPKEIFTHLNEGASMFAFGGWTYGPPDSISPPMGNGLFPVDDYDKSSYFARIGFIDKGGNFVDIIAHKMNKYVDNDKCYNVREWGYRFGGYRETFAFGGPGGKCGI